MSALLRPVLIAAALGFAGMALPDLGRAAEALVTQGIGTTSCARLAADLKPNEGLGNPVNLVLYAWVQGYVSAANIALLEDGGRHVDLKPFDERKVLEVVSAFCRANPDANPIAAVDEMIRSSPKVQSKWQPGTVAWEE
jgi:hypothetical protein